MLKTAEKRSSTSFGVRAAPKSWSKYTIAISLFCLSCLLLPGQGFYLSSLSWLPFYFELIPDHANWSFHKFILNVWLSIRLNNLKARNKTNWTKIKDPCYPETAQGFLLQGYSVAHCSDPIIVNGLQQLTHWPSQFSYSYQYYSFTKVTA